MRLLRDGAPHIILEAEKEKTNNKSPAGANKTLNVEIAQHGCLTNAYSFYKTNSVSVVGRFHV
jgi:hypothetical protein